MYYFNNNLKVTGFTYLSHSMNTNELIKIDPTSAIPKYQQLIDSILDAIENGIIDRGELLPSINEVSANHHMARMTVAKAYEELRQRGVIDARHGKGFFVTSTQTHVELNVFVLLDSLSPFKEVLYEAIVKAFGDEAVVQVFFHHHNMKVFENLVLSHIGHFNYYLIMPHFQDDVSEILRKVPKEKLIVMDIDSPQLGEDYAIIYQDFEKNILKGLTDGLELIKKYKSLSLVLSRQIFQFTPNGIINGFLKFCYDNNIPNHILSELEEENLDVGHAYILFRENEIIKFLNWSNKRGFKLGHDIGLLSYDDTPIKEILADGITVISNDFSLMGKRAVEMIIQKKKGRIANDCSFIQRKSL